MKNNIILITIIICLSMLGMALGYSFYSKQKFPEPKPTTKLRVNEMDTRLGDTLYYNFSSDKDIMTLGVTKTESEGYLILIP